MSLSRQILIYLALAFSPFFAITSEAKTTSLRILTENWPPISYEENGKARGMAVELVQSIQKHIGNKSSNEGKTHSRNGFAALTGINQQAHAGFETPDINSNMEPNIEVVPWARGYKFLQDVPNTLLFTIIRTPERERLFTMLGPVARGNISIFALAKPKNKFSTKAEMKDNAAIAATRGTAFETALRNQKFKNIIDVRDAETAVKLLISGRIDFLCDDSLTINDILRKMKIASKELKSISEFETYDLYLGFSPGTDPAIVHSWKKSLEALKKNGQYAAIYRKWFNNLKPPQAVEVIGLSAKN